MRFSSLHEMTVIHHHEELLRQAEHERLLTAIRRSKGGGYHALTCWLGGKLVKWGQQLACSDTLNNAASSPLAQTRYTSQHL